MAKKSHHIHDKFVKTSFSDPERAVAFFEQFLPETLKNSLDFRSLKVLQESYIQNDLTEHFSDMVFEVQSIDDEPIDLVLLVEHKSSPDKYVLIQVGHYMFSHWFKCVSERKPLKIIVPIIYYQGKRKWQQPVLSSLFPTVTGDLNLYIPKLHHIFIALNTLSDESISRMKNGLMAAAVLAQKQGVNLIKLADDLIKIIKLFPEKDTPGNFIEQIFVYVVSVSDIPPPEFKRALTFIPDHIKDNAMTTYMMIKQEGQLEGKIEGKLEGQLESKIEITLRCHDQGISLEMTANITAQTVEDVIKILKENGRMM